MYICTINKRTMYILCMHIHLYITLYKPIFNIHMYMKGYYTSCMKNGVSGRVYPKSTHTLYIIDMCTLCILHYVLHNVLCALHRMMTNSPYLG